MGDFERRRRGFRIFFWAIATLVVLGFIGSAVWNVYVFKTCRAEGGTIIQCNAALQNSHYIAVDEMDQ